jgi:hypothetical protein
MHWDFPPSLVNGLRHTAQPLLPIEFQRLPAVLNLAGRLADSGAVTLAGLKDLPLMLLNLLQLDPEQLLKTAPDAHSLTDVSMFIG